MGADRKPPAHSAQRRGGDRGDGAVGKLRRAIKGSEVWYVVWTEGRRSDRISTGETDEGRAHDFLVQWRAARAARATVRTIAELLDHYERDREAEGVKTLHQIRSFLGPVRAHFGALGVDDVTPAYVRSYIAARRKAPRRDGKPGVVGDRAISLELAYLRAALTLAQKEGIIERLPFIKLPRNAGVRVRETTLTLAETRALVAAAHQPETPLHLRLWVMLRLLHAVRSVAVLDLTWRSVDLERGLIYYSRSDPRPSPNKRRPTLPIPDSLVPLLEEARAVAESDYVIEWEGARVKSVKKALGSLFRRAGLVGVRSHDLRRTAATLAMERGASTDAAARFISDSVEVTERHYAHLDPTGVLATIRLLEGAIRGGRDE